MALMDYDLTFIHRPGKGNAIADALSRLRGRETGVDPEVVAQSIDPVVVNSVRSTNSLKARLKTHGMNDIDTNTWTKAQRTDPTWSSMIKFLEDDELPQDERLAKWISIRSDEFIMSSGLLFRVKLTTREGISDCETKLVVPRTLIGRVMSRFHDDKAEGGHLGVGRVYAKVKEACWWPRMYQDVREWVADCVQCQSIGKTSAQKATIGGHVVGENPFDCIAMDLLAMPESWAGNKYVLVVMDYATRYAIAAPVKDKTARTVADALLQHVLLVHGPARRLLSDNGKEFKNVVVAELCRLTNMARVFTSPYNAQCDGMVERFNRTLLKMLGCYVDNGQRDWDVHLPWMIYAYNTSYSTTHSVTPFELTFGRKPNTSLELEIEAEVGRRGVDMGEAKLIISDHVHRMRRQAALMLANKQQREEAVANNHRKSPMSYKVGDVVWLKSPPKLDDGAKLKLAPKWRGPYMVVKVTPPVNVRVKPIGSSAASSTVHIDRVKPFKMREMEKEVGEVVGEGEEQEPPKTKRGRRPKVAEGRYVVEAVEGHRFKDGVLEFLLKWEGYTEKTWTPEQLMNCHALVEQYFKRNPAAII